MNAVTVGILQPNYVPWLGYFDLISRTDTFVWLDTVQYTKRDWRNRNRIGGGGDWQWISIPVWTRGRRLQRVQDVEIDGRAWIRKHLAAVERFYRRAPHFEPIYAFYADHLERSGALLAPLTIGLCEAICGLLKIKPRFLRSSALPGLTATRDGLILQICKRLECTRYLSGPSAKAYLDPEPFQAEGVEVTWMDYGYSAYRDGLEGLPALSVLDPLFWLGAEGLQAWLRSPPELRTPTPSPRATRS